MAVFIYKDIVKHNFFLNISLKLNPSPWALASVSPSVRSTVLENSTVGIRLDEDTEDIVFVFKAPQIVVANCCQTSFNPNGP